MEGQDDSFCYIRASAGRGRETITELERRGGKNLNAYMGEGDKTMIYYIGKDNVIEWTNDDSEIGYIILNSGWTELKLKEPKKERIFIISVKEGNDSCEKCPLYGKCEDPQEWRCELAALLKSDKPLDGKTLEIIEVKPDDIPFHVFGKREKNM